MKRPALFSFHFENDIWRANQVRNIGAVEGYQPVSGYDWEWNIERCVQRHSTEYGDMG